jgi:exopolysaccharide biosynthesis polyprenyl glycosylphosphotransferase
VSQADARTAHPASEASVPDAGDTPSEQVAAVPTRLREGLAGLDALAFFIGWAVALLVAPPARRDLLSTLLLAIAVTGLGLWLIGVYGLHLARVSAIRSVEISKLARAAVLTGIGEIVILRVVKVPGRLYEAAIGVALSFVLLVAFRSAYRAYLAHARRNGRYTRSLLVVGANGEAAELVALMATHPEAGYRVVGVVGDKRDALAAGLGARWVGSVDQTEQQMDRLNTNGALLVLGALDSHDINVLARRLQERGAHIHLSNGLRGIDFRRVRAQPIAYEPLYYLEAPVLARRQFLMKRLLDLVAGGLGLLLTLPLIVLVWLLVKIEDRGPLFFKQVRIGQNGKPFTVYKFRTMVVDAEAKLKELMETNERAGPLFKMTRDPRVTRIGQFLRDSSLDELPQLINVIRGEMSLVGPRPALPSEVAQFDAELRDRLKVKPGVTGLWQVEARDNPSFDAYRRLDLYYVENWSISLDLVIMLATVEHIIARLLVALFSRRSAKHAEPSPDAAA